MNRSPRTYLPFVRWDFIRGSGRDLLIWSQIPLEDETRGATEVVVLQGGWHVWWLFATLQRQHHQYSLPPPTPVLTRLLPLSDSKTSPVYGQLSPPMQLLSIWSTSSVTSGWNRNYARSNGGQLARIILARISRFDRGSSRFYSAAPCDISLTSRAPHRCIKKMRNARLEILRWLPIKSPR